MSEVKRYAAELDQMYLLGDNEKIDLTVFERFFVEASDYEALQSRLDAAEAEVQRQKQTIAGMNDAHWKVVRQLAERDAVLRETADSLRCSKVFPALLESIDALLSSAEPVKAEFCCELSYKVAKQAAWGARDLTQCKCDHNEYCEHCWPDDFREGGKWHGGFETKQSAPERVSVPVELLERVATHLEWDGDESQTVIQYANKCDALAAELLALLNGGEA